MSVHPPQLQHPKGMLTSQDFFPASWTTWFIVCRSTNVRWQCTLGRLDWHVPDCILTHVPHMTAGQIKVGWWNKCKKVWCSSLGSNWFAKERKILPTFERTRSTERALVPVLLCITHHLKSGMLTSLPTLFPPCVTAHAFTQVSYKWVIMKMKKWSWQWTQFIQLRKEAWKKIQDFNRVWIHDLAIPVRCSTNWAMKPLTMKPAPNISGFIAQLVEHRTDIAGSRVQTPLKSWIFFSGFFMQLHKLCSLRWSFLHFHFISAVHIWFISYIINKWVIHMKIKSWLRPLRPTVLFFKKDHPKIIFCLLLTIPGWLSLHSIQQPSCPPVYNWLGWSGQVQEGHFSCWWHLCGVLQNSPPTRVQSPQCTLSMDFWCMTDNKPHCPWRWKNVPWC